VPVEAGKNGYQPDKIIATPGEKLILVFTRTTEARCLAQVKVAGGELTDLPVGKPVEVAVTAPPDKGATIRFACGMDMMTGLIAVN
jgi:plastocyanin domain-containing protein